VLLKNKGPQEVSGNYRRKGKMMTGRAAESEDVGGKFQFQFQFNSYLFMFYLFYVFSVLGAP
jgi:hypothetical protein